MMSVEVRLSALLYGLLMHEDVPVAKLERQVGMVMQAGSFGFGSPELAALAQRLARQVLGGEEAPVGLEPSAVDDHGMVDEIAGADGALMAPDGGPLTEPMVQWLEDFDERVTRRPEFIAAVNEAAGHGMQLGPDTTAWVFDRQRELYALPRVAGPEGGQG